MLKATTMPDDEPHRAAEAVPTQQHCFSMRFTSSRRGAQLARKVAVRRLEQWGHPPTSDTSCSVALVVGELAANAVCHGLVPGREFALDLTYTSSSGLVRIEVSDAHPTRPPGHPAPAGHEAESGRGLLIVDVLATRWGTNPRTPVGKTVWAELETAP
ncbi:ATP-binding protein [Streptomyces sp. RKND-216]|uniref:ATP-binding protein n=1 Tax=Streptomyces sp. RKND-216 TaxID=2562581 RepID=UPI00109E0504|nr:ATP-binding protein [Streptomyces sp. RKND-216]THA24765.1 ATP-binding protein [Streptomyces sp. RKND-216]